MYVVIIEWDGDIPPRTYYSRMHALGLRVRVGDKKKEVSPIARRARGDGSVVAQEGAVMCASESLARLVATYAVEDGAAMVRYAYVPEFNDFYVQTEDAKVFQRMESIYGRRGRPTGEKVDCTVQCWECAKSYPYPEQEYLEKAATCPTCMGVRVRQRVGDPYGYQMPKGVDILEAWAMTRFSTGEYEYATVDDAYGTAPSFVESNIIDDLQADTFAKLRKSADFLNKVRQLPEVTQMRVLDAAYVSHLMYTEAERRDSRVQTCVKLYEQGVSPAQAPLIEKVGEIDVLSVSRILPIEQVVNLFKAVK